MDAQVLNNNTAGVALCAALRRFMDDYKSGKIKFELEQ